LQIFAGLVKGLAEQLLEEFEEELPWRRLKNVREWQIGVVNEVSGHVFEVLNHGDEWKHVAVFTPTLE